MTKQTFVDNALATFSIYENSVALNIIKDDGKQVAEIKFTGSEFLALLSQRQHVNCSSVLVHEVESSDDQEKSSYPTDEEAGVVDIAVITSELAKYGIIAVWTFEKHFVLRETTPKIASDHLRLRYRCEELIGKSRTKDEHTEMNRISDNISSISSQASELTPEDSNVNQWTFAQAATFLEELQRDKEASSHV